MRIQNLQSPVFVNEVEGGQTPRPFDISRLALSLGKNAERKKGKKRAAMNFNPFEESSER